MVERRSIAGDNSVMLGALGPHPQLWPTRGENTAQDTAFVLIDALSLVAV